MKVLITAGATWVKIDDVRIITNRFTVNTGLYLAKEPRESFLHAIFCAQNHSDFLQDISSNIDLILAITSGRVFLLVSPINLS